MNKIDQNFVNQLNLQNYERKNYKNKIRFLFQILENLLIQCQKICFTSISPMLSLGVGWFDQDKFVLEICILQKGQEEIFDFDFDSLLNCFSFEKIIHVEIYIFQCFFFILNTLNALLPVIQKLV